MAITYSGLYLETRRTLKEAGDPASDLSARELICFAAQKNRDTLIRDGGLYVGPDLEEKVAELVRRHLDGEPVAYIIGEWEFYGLTVAVSPSVLIPRPDTETLVDQALEYLKTQGPCRVLDLCAGSGCIGLALAVHAPEARIVMGEVSDAALKLCHRNIWTHSLTARVLPMRVDALEEPNAHLGHFACIVCNPPYIPTEDIDKLDPSVRDYEPHLALDGGEDGLRFYEAIAQKWRNALQPNGQIFFEIGVEQAMPVMQILRQNGFGEVQYVPDRNGIPRVVTGIRYPDV